MRFLPLLGLLLPLWWSCSPGGVVEDEKLTLPELLVAERFAEARDSLAAYGARPRVPEDGPQSAQYDYYRARLTYQSGNFPEALEQARLALPRLLRHRGRIDPNVLIQCLHLLAELHFDHIVYEDSVGIYQRWAADLIDAGTPAPVRAENQLCLALDQLANYTFTTQVAAARLGKGLLTELPRPHPDKYARLLVAEALGLKKYADEQPDPTRRQLLEEAATLLDEAVVLYRKTQSVRWREAQREKVIIVSRFGDRNRFERELAPLRYHDTPRPVTDTAPASAPPFGYPDRLRGYFHHQATGDVDSVLFYYRRFLPRAPAFDFHLRDETYWTLIQYGLRAGDLKLAGRSARDQLVLYGCCSPDEAQRTVADLLPTLSSEYYCKYPLADLGRVRLAEYRAGRSVETLEEARLIFDHILGEWETIFTTGEEESAVSQLNNITSRIVTNANEVAWLWYRERPGTRNADRLLQAVERTKTFLLLKDRIEATDAATGRVRLDSLRRWQSEINLLKEQEMRDGLSRADRQRLLQLSVRHREANADARRQRLGIYRESAAALPTVSDLRRQLGRDGAAVVYAEGNGRLLAQYVDADTVVAYASPPLDTLSRSVKTLLGMLETARPTVGPQAYAAAARLLFDQVLGPVSGRLSGRKRLLIVPAGPLRRLPFAALPTREDTVADRWEELSYLLSGLDIYYAPSLRVEDLNRERRREEWRNATLGVWVHPELTAYFGSGATHRVENAPAGSAVFAGPECRVATFRRRSGDFAVLNLALHAAGDPYNAHRNYLYFAPGDSLNGAAIAQLDCRARLVLLTACETGLGDGIVAEGTFSIARSFQQLGVPDVVYSLWRIPAAASAKLEERFFLHLYGGASAAAALARAQRELAGGEAGAIYAFPGSWAGLVKG
ncbi:CHAT domain-containing protein [Neolewinella litorea]|uniref:CHAT domain-containing protein n=1 Tax=Neolewinella litorea TaxID=2562452 RepID=A0A4S4NDF5_9BACT|nr:CHAT domain-containing protein [Neolewinella litorea]THH36557.1 CHAT domain-containing protein [Neolewinella litorea]